MRSIALLLLIACGGKHAAQPVAADQTAHADEHHGDHGDEHHGDHHAGMPVELSKFHDVLAPRWHADHDAARMKSTCDAMPDFHATADALAKSVPPSGANADTWTTGTRQIVDAVGKLDVTCKANDASNFERAFAHVHDSFEGLMAALMRDKHRDDRDEPAEPAEQEHAEHHGAKK